MVAVGTRAGGVGLADLLCCAVAAKFLSPESGTSRISHRALWGGDCRQFGDAHVLLLEPSGRSHCFAVRAALLLFTRFVRSAFRARSRFASNSSNPSGGVWPGSLVFCFRPASYRPSALHGSKS